MESSTKVQRVSQLCGLAVIITLAIICYRFGILSSVERIQALVHTAGIWGPILFIGLQIIQVTFPIIPGGMTTVAAVSIFGPFWGFVYNYVGVGLGSVIAFLIVRQVGQPFIHAVIPPEVCPQVRTLPGQPAAVRPSLCHRHPAPCCTRRLSLHARRVDQNVPA
ncbi:TVP38/TMEM64 family protein [Lacticaseibacillus thailandensis]|uniref:TVP38/TMEM64 family protein n=1 Tax=Lacticaseibacillus thailandensis TaxID=381741 RepID=UPI000AB6CA8A|nr:VTT domain-containing protein [Lacticaseibacillus thailandensis]